MLNSFGANKIVQDLFLLQDFNQLLRHDLSMASETFVGFLL